MNFKTKSLLLLFFLTSLISLAQTKEIYVDDNMNRMTKEQYLNNCSKHIFSCSTTVSDSLVINTVHSRFKFGKISPEVRRKLLSELYKNNKPKTDQTIVLRFVERHLGNHKSYVEDYFDRLYKIDGNYFMFSERANKLVSFQPRVLKNSQYYRYLESFMYREKRCLKKINKKTNSEVFHLTKTNLENTKNLGEGFNIIKRNDYLEDIRSSLPDSTRFAIISPKGDYFSSSRFIKPNAIIEFINKSDWSEYKRDLKISNSIKHKNGYGIFNKFYFKYNISCF